MKFSDIDRSRHEQLTRDRPAPTRGKVVERAENVVVLSIIRANVAWDWGSCVEASQVDGITGLLALNDTDRHRSGATNGRFFYPSATDMRGGCTRSRSPYELHGRVDLFWSSTARRLSVWMVDGPRVRLRKS